jgi:hypothetical protein
MSLLQELLNDNSEYMFLCNIFILITVAQNLNAIIMQENL